ncbi:hypothetical protein B0H63DRAFT_463902 [Podospora didyma]|uniref:Uncharacterized protein n=1 Tax=Podospora didyma TaxID=330526 RepID=A0AAE0NY27_9PEZI|nr:hypothetical protein B0H63DRAFT_463902 [Podospora didyma]
MVFLDPRITNGTCYWAAGKRLDSVFSPVGNAALGHHWCCQLGDKAMKDNSCYHDPTDTTYLAGCTDPEYLDSSCPDKKGFKDQPWAGLVYCTPNHWVACEQKAKPTTVAKGDSCSPCSQDRASMTVAFTDVSPIKDVARLPKAAGDTIEWYPGFLPTTTSESSSTTASSISSSSASTSTPTSTSPLHPGASSIISTATSSPSAAAIPAAVTETGGLSTGAKAGIGIGAAVVGLLILGALSAMFILLRRRRKNDEAPASSGPVGDAKDGYIGDPPPGVAEMPTPALPKTPSLSELGSDQTARPWSLRSELQGNNTSTFLSANSPQQPNTYMESGYGQHPQAGYVEPQQTGYGFQPSAGYGQPQPGYGQSPPGYRGPVMVGYGHPPPARYPQPTETGGRVYQAYNPYSNELSGRN